MIKRCIVGLFLAFGISLVAYPAVANYIFESQQNNIIENYELNSSSLSNQEKQELLSAVQEYNASLLIADFQLYDSLTGNLSIFNNQSYNNSLSIDDSGMIGSLSVPCIDVNLPIYNSFGSSDVQEEQMKKGVICMDNTSLPIGGENTHAVLVGHTGLSNARLLTDLIKVEIGDTFDITVLDDTLTYEVDQIKTVYPDDTSDLNIIPGSDYVTLVTCTPYGVNTYRLLVRGHRISNSHLSDAQSTQTVQVGTQSNWTKDSSITVCGIIGIYVFIIVMCCSFILFGKNR